MIFTTAARHASRRFASAGSRCLSTSARSASSSNAAMPLLVAGGLAAFGLTQYNETTKCFGGSNKTDEAVKAVEDKFVTYWPRNIMVSWLRNALRWLLERFRIHFVFCNDGWIDGCINSFERRNIFLIFFVKRMAFSHAYFQCCKSNFL